MRFAFTDEQRLLQKSVRELLAKECPPSAVRASWSGSDGEEDGHRAASHSLEGRQSGRSLDRWRRLAELGAVGLTVPEPYGGLGMNELDLVLILEESGRAALPEPLAENTAVAAPLLAEIGSPSLQERLLPAIAEGKIIVTVGLASLPFVVDAHIADWMILEHEGALHAIERSAASCKAERSVDGSRRLFRVTWQPSPETVIAEGEPARQAIARAYDRGALAAAAQLLGIAQRLIDITVEYVKVREQFQKPIGSFQAIKHHLADALVKLEFARPVVYRAAYTVAKHLDSEERPLHVSMAKAFASDAAELAARVALQCHGAIGYSFEHDLHLFMKRGWALSASWGDAAAHRRRVAAALLDAPPAIASASHANGASEAPSRDLTTPTKTAGDAP